MKEYSKEQLVQEYGKPGWAPTILIDKVRYLSGIDVFDEILKSKNNLPGKSPIYFEKYPEGLIIQHAIGFTSIRTAIKIDKIKYFVIEPQNQIIAKKDKSVVGRALIGGLLLGPLGAVVGGASGIGSKDTKLSDIPDNILTICFEEEGKEKYILFSVTNKNYKDVEKSLKTNFTERYKHFNDIIKEEPKVQTEYFSVADEIMKLKELLDQGLLTQSEFDLQKQKILNK